MVNVTVFRGSKFDGAEEIDDLDFPSIPRIGETVSMFDHDRATFEKVVDVNYHAGKDGARVRILLKPNPTGGMTRVNLGGV